MKLSFVSWKKMIYLCAAIITILGTNNTCFAAKPSVKYDDRMKASGIRSVACSPKSITLDAYVWADKKPTGVEIYRAKIKKNGKRGSFEKIGACKKLKQDIVSEGKWRFIYKDTTVKIRQAYVYKCRAFLKTGNTKKYQEKNFTTRKGVAAETVGEYACNVIECTSNQLIIKITGKNKNNGPLECYVDDKHVKDTHLVYKNDGDAEVQKYLTAEAYSYDGREWHSEPRFCIKGKESIYLRFSGEDLAISDYQHVQMIMEYMVYNMCAWDVRTMPQMRFNLTSGEAFVDNFILWDVEKQEWITNWEDEVFSLMIPIRI